jgi:hypothetical protein
MTLRSRRRFLPEFGPEPRFLAAYRVGEWEEYRLGRKKVARGDAHGKKVRRILRRFSCRRCLSIRRWYNSNSLSVMGSDDDDAGFLGTSLARIHP